MLDLFRAQGLSSILETITVKGHSNYVNRSIKLLFDTMPVTEGLRKGAVEAKSIAMDRFPFNLPYRYNLAGFLTWLSKSTEHQDLFVELNACVTQLLNQIIQFCEFKGWDLPSTLYTFGVMARQTTELGHLLHLAVTEKFNIVTNWHPAVFIDLRCAPKTEEQYEHIQSGFDHLLSAVAGKSIKGKFCRDFQNRHTHSMQEYKLQSYTFTLEDCKYLVHFCFPCW